jgi:hypothetical protein
MARRPRLPIAPLAAALLALAALPPACQLAFGDFTIDDTAFDAGPSAGGAAGGSSNQGGAAGGSGGGSGGAAGGGGTMPVPGICEAGQHQCVGPVLQICNTNRDGWLNKQECASSGLCAAEMQACLEPACSEGDFRCSQAELETCNASRNGWTTATPRWKCAPWRRACPV